MKNSMVNFKRRNLLKGLGLSAAGIGLADGLLRPASASAGMMDNYLDLMLGMARERKLKPDDGLSVLLLGTGSPAPSYGRANASTMVIAGDKAVIVDIGGGVTLRLAQSGISNVPLLLLTHFHSDHIADLGQLLMSRAVFGGAELPLNIIGPEGVKEVVSGFNHAFERDRQYRVGHHGEDAVKWNGYAAEVAEVKPGLVYRQDGLEITMFEVDHKPVIPAVGYKFEYKGKSVVVSGDTVKVPRMVEMAENCDLLVHEAMNKQMVEMGAARFTDPRVQKMAFDIFDYHTMTDEVAEIAAEAGVKKLALTHLVPVPINHAMELMFTRGMRKKFKGPIIVGRDQLEIKV